MSRVVRAVLVALIGLAAAAPARAHHVGAYVPRDNDVSANFKQIKFSTQAGKFDVGLRLYADGALRKALRAQAANLPPGLDGAILAALRAGDAAAVEAGLMVFFAALVRDLALEADRQLADVQTPPAARVAGGAKILEAIWRYYNLVDFAVSQRDPKAATAVRLSFDEAEGYAKAQTPAPERMRAPLTRIARILTGVIAAASPPARNAGGVRGGSPPSITRNAGGV